MALTKRLLAGAGIVLPLLLIPVLVASCQSEAYQIADDPDGRVDRPEDIVEEYPELDGIVVSAQEYLRMNTQEVLAAAAPPIAEDGEYDGKVLVFGAVRKPSILPLEPRMRLTGAIAQTGGLRLDANSHVVLIIRRRADLQSSRVVLVDYSRVLGFANLAQDLPLLPKDVVFVPWRGRARRTHMDPILSYLKRDITTLRLVNFLEKLGP